MELTLPRATLSLTLVFIVISTVDAMVSVHKKNNFIAFPRYGRSGYLAFPRMGRSQSKIAGSESPASCCNVGIKSEFSVDEEGKEEMRAFCTASVPECCSGLREFVDETPDGRVFSICIPKSVYPSALSKLRSILSQ